MRMRHCVVIDAHSHGCCMCLESHVSCRSGHTSLKIHAVPFHSARMGLENHVVSVRCANTEMSVLRTRDVREVGNSGPRCWNEWHDVADWSAMTSCSDCNRLDFCMWVGLLVNSTAHCSHCSLSLGQCVCPVVADVL